MSLSAFGDKAAMPDENMLLSVLKEKKELWDGIREHVSSSYKSVSEEWKFYSKEAGWSLVIKSGKRTLLYLIPLNISFKVNFVFGEKAAEAAKNEKIPEHVLKIISEAKVYAEGRSFMIDVNNKEDAGTAIMLIGIKDKN